MGRTRLQGGRPLLAITARNGDDIEDADGCAADNQQVIGTYLHGLFDTPAVIARWLAAVGLDGLQVPLDGGLAAKMRHYRLLADHVRQHIDVHRIGELVGIGKSG
jgi:adenosylcobyric acid synthase